MEICGNLWKSVEIYGNHLEFTWLWLKIINPQMEGFPTKHDHVCGSFGTLILSHSHLDSSWMLQNVPPKRLGALPNAHHLSECHSPYLEKTGL